MRKIVISTGLKLNEWIYFIWYLILGFIGVSLSNKGYYVGNGLILTRVLCMVPFYELGILYKAKLEKRDNVPNIGYFAFVFVIQLLIITFNGEAITYGLAWCDNFPDNVFLPYIQSFVAIMFWLRIARILLPVIQDNEYIRMIADNAYTIMINQFMGFMLVKTLFAVIHKYTVFCSDFLVDEFKGDIWYYYLPQDMKQWFLVYIVAGIVVPIIMQLCINVMKDRLLRVIHWGANRFRIYGK